MSGYPDSTLLRAVDEWPPRAEAILARYETFGELRRATDRELMNLHNVGRMTVREVRIIAGEPVVERSSFFPGKYGRMYWRMRDNGCSPEISAHYVSVLAQSRIAIALERIADSLREKK